jgi:lipid II:glycine glycyltransferase (peptidoglycan interpeptide bridge formation enzyme)
MEVDSWLTGRRGVALPFTDECEPLCRDADSFRRVFAETLEYAKVRAWKYLECRGGKAWFGDAPASTTFLGHRLDLRAGEKALFAGIESAGRRAVRKAEQSGLSVEFSQSLEAVREFHGLLCITRKRHGVPPQPFVFFANIQRHILAQNHGWVVLARHGGVAVAGAVFFHSGTTALYKFGASDEKHQHLRGNNLVMWTAIKRYAQQGFEAMSFGRTALENVGLRRFKLNWGTQEYPIDYVQFDLRAHRFVSGRDDYSGRYTRVFRFLPIPVARLIGAALYRHVA